MNEQLSFNLDRDFERGIDVGKSVTLIKPNEKTQDIETFFYLQRFENKVGTVQEILKGKVVSIVVDFGGELGEGIFHENELIPKGESENAKIQRKANKKIGRNKRKTKRN
nr:hypothetical protein 30 [Bacillaceae bacterium]